MNKKLPHMCNCPIYGIIEKCDGCGECEELHDWDKYEYNVKVANGDGYFDEKGNYHGTCNNDEY